MMSLPPPGMHSISSGNGSMMQKQNQLLWLSASVPLVAALLPRILRFVVRIPPMIYDTFLVDLTEVWYRAVLSRVERDERVLDVGIGTGGALARSSKLITDRSLKVVGIDYNALYINQAADMIRQTGLSSNVEVHCMSVYDTKAMETLTASQQGADKGAEKFDSAYFSGSLSLMPDPVLALRDVANVVKSGGKIYVTQTFQNESPLNSVIQHVKPAIKLVSTVDFGQLITNEQILSLYGMSGLKLVEHGVLPGSVDNIFQSAYLSVLQVP